jgi:hypothetical protein
MPKEWNENFKTEIFQSLSTVKEKRPFIKTLK